MTNKLYPDLPELVRNKCCYVNKHGDSCQFKMYESSLAEDGHEYCIFHFPAKFKSEWDVRKSNELLQAINNEIQKGIDYFYGVKFPDNIHLHFHQTAKNGIKFVNSVFGNPDSTGTINIHTDEQISINTMSFDDSVFHSTIDFGPKPGLPFHVRILIIENSIFHQNVTFRHGGIDLLLEFEYCQFHKGLALFGPLNARVSFEGSEFFDSPVYFQNNLSSLSEASSFHETKFYKYKYYYETPFRLLRKRMNEIGDRNQEAYFFNAEQRCIRDRDYKKRTLKWLLSWLYDNTSEYGSNPGRSLLTLFLLFLNFNNIYWIIINYIHKSRISEAFDNYLLAAKISLMQIIKPSEFFSLKAHDQYNPIVYIVNQADYIPYIGLFQSIVSLSSLALFLLALRWSFRRGQ